MSCTQRAHTHTCTLYVHRTTAKWSEVNGSEDKLSICQIRFLLLLSLVLLFDRCFVRWLFGKLSQFCWLSSILLVEQYLSMKSNCCRCVYSAILIVVATHSQMPGLCWNVFGGHTISLCAPKPNRANSSMGFVIHVKSQPAKQTCEQGTEERNK